ncbi:MAG: RNA polymerase sigma-70 factor, partial [Cyclobacteriaceae bacterium]|nr:RNA polymerase sigma-70 factor [Cyclobacteriaceae bacterium]
MLPNQNIEELNLLKRLKKGDEAAFEILYNIYKGRLYSFSIKLVKSDDLACDIIHDVFVKVWEKRKQINHESNFSSYLHTICKNRIFNFL